MLQVHRRSMHLALPTRDATTAERPTETAHKARALCP